MKRRLLLMLAATLLALAALGAWLWQERDRVALATVNRVLADFGVTVTKLQGFNLSAGSLRIARGEWQMTGSSKTHSLRRLNVEFQLRPLSIDHLHVQSVQMYMPEQSAGEGEPVSLADAYQQWRALPVEGVQINTLRVDNHQATGLSWQRSGAGDDIRAHYHDLVLTATISDQPGSVGLDARLRTGEQTLATVDATLQWDDIQHRLKSSVVLEIGKAWPQLRALPALQAAAADYPADIGGDLRAELATSLRDTGGELAAPLQISAAVSNARVGKSLRGNVALREVVCNSLDQCRGELSLDAGAEPVALDSVAAEKGAFECGGTWSLQNAVIEFTAGKRCKAQVTKLATGELNLPVLSVALGKLNLRWPTGETGQPSIKMAFETDVLRPQLPDQWLPAVRLSGEAALQGDDATLAGAVKTAAGQSLLSIDGDHNLASSMGSGRIAIDQLRFSTQKPLSKLLPGWPYPADALAGTANMHTTLRWQQEQGELVWRGSGDVQLNKIAGKYDDIGALGINGQTAFEIDAAGLRSTAPVAVSIDTLDIGVPLQALHLNASVDTGGQTYALHGLDVQLLGGAMHASDFVYRADGELEPLSVRVNGISLSRVLELAAFEAVSGTGTIDGDLPLQIHSDTVTMTGGWLAGREPGVIRYSSSDSARAIAASNASLQLVSEALSNYHYETLRADATLDRAGDLKLAITMRGVNPDMRGGQRINLNLNVSNNIPQLLRTLRAGRIVDDMLARHLNKSR